MRTDIHKPRIRHIAPHAVDMHGRDEIEALLQQFADALTAGDGAAAATYWHVPVFLMGDDHEHVVTHASEVASFFGGAKAQYQARGIADTRPEIVSLDWLTERTALVTVRWPWLDDRGRQIGEEASTYLVKAGPGGTLKLRAAIMHGESEPEEPATLSRIDGDGWTA